MRAIQKYLSEQDVSSSPAVIPSTPPKRVTRKIKKGKRIKVCPKGPVKGTKCFYKYE